MLVGYARTSTVEQEAGLENQVATLLATGCNKLFAEQVSSVAMREQFELALDFVREGDVLVATRLDRLARSTSDFLKIIDRLDAKQVGLRILDFGGSEIDTKSATGRMMMTMFAAFAEFERSLLLERQRIGIAKAKADGKYKGRVPTARAMTADIIKLKDEGVGASDIAKETGVSRASVYRILADAA
ncbi:recombinase family protein [Parasphingorhabdus sp.]|uniref:recombinase family protein n=1 Tax=Parasphingorhabdus sp. TaxID=2709688 RepID=UPI003A951C27